MITVPRRTVPIGVPGAASLRLYADLPAKGSDVLEMAPQDNGPVSEADRLPRDELRAQTQQLLARISHEMRTPLTAILGYAGMLAEPGHDHDARKAYLDLIQEHGQNLMTIIDQMLDLSMMSNDRVPIFMRPCSPWRIVADVASSMRIRARNKGLAFAVEFVDNLPELIQSDPIRLRQILICLVDNALKFTNVGGVRIIVRLAGPNHDRRLRFEVVDTGIGMTEEQIRQAFQPFTQADEAMTRRYGGMGIGLTIAQRLATLLNGEITVQSQPNEGSSFCLSVATGSLDDVRMIPEPREAGPRFDTRPPKPARALDGLNILVAEDGPDNQRLIHHYLRRAGANVHVVANGREACDAAWHAIQNSEPYHLILMDMQMPVCDGYEATRLLRANGYTRPIVALTAHASAEDCDRCLAAGCDDYETKPINRGRLIDLIRRWTQHPPADDCPAALI